MPMLRLLIGEIRESDKTHGTLEMRENIIKCHSMFVRLILGGGGRVDAMVTNEGIIL